MAIETKNKIIKAFDDNLPDDSCEALAFIDKNIKEFAPYIGMIKLGMKTVTKLGPVVIELAHSYGFEVFYDLKFCDIPETVKGAVYEATKLGVKIINVHAFGAKKMMIAAREGRDKALSENPKLNKPILIAVTVLTSISQEEFNNEIGIPGKIEDTVLRYAITAKECGLDGVVCSPKEIEKLKYLKVPVYPLYRRDFVLVTPGIRPTWSSQDDQQRVMTPKEALELGADYLVIGRPISTVEGAIKTLEEIS